MAKRKSENDNHAFFLRDRQHAAAEFFVMRRRREEQAQQTLRVRQAEAMAELERKNREQYPDWVDADNPGPPLTTEQMLAAGIPEHLHPIVPMFSSLIHFREVFGLPDPVEED